MGLGLMGLMLVIIIFYMTYTACLRAQKRRRKARSLLKNQDNGPNENLENESDINEDEDSIVISDGVGMF